MIETEDPRKAGIKDGLRQLTVEQIDRLLTHDGPLCLDTWNYHEGAYCPLAVGLGLDTVFKEPSHEKVYSVLALMGYKINNTWGRLGQFYTTDRKADLIRAAEEVRAEKLNHN